MLLPDRIGLIFLVSRLAGESSRRMLTTPPAPLPLPQSATSPNREEFAEWVGCTKSKKVFVLETSKRPVRAGGQEEGGARRCALRGIRHRMTRCPSHCPRS